MKVARREGDAPLAGFRAPGAVPGLLDDDLAPPLLREGCLETSAAPGLAPGFDSPCRAAARPWALAPAEVECLLLLGLQPLSIRRLGTMLARGRPTVRAALAALTRAGLCSVVTNASGPAVLHRLTPKGMEVVLALKRAQDHLGPRER